MDCDKELADDSHSDEDPEHSPSSLPARAGPSGQKRAEAGTIEAISCQHFM